MGEHGFYTAKTVVRYHYRVPYKGPHHEGDSVTIINRTTVNIKIKDLEKLLANTQNPYYKKVLETDIKSYRAIKNLFDIADKM